MPNLLSSQRRCFIVQFVYESDASFVQFIHEQYDQVCSVVSKTRYCLFSTDSFILFTNKMLSLISFLKNEMPHLVMNEMLDCINCLKNEMLHLFRLSKTKILCSP